MKIDLSNLRSVLYSYREALDVTEDVSRESSIDGALYHTLQLGVVHNFKVAYELFWSYLKQSLEVVSLSHINVNKLSYLDMLREASKNGLIGDFTNWIFYRDARNLVSSTYDQKKSLRVYVIAKDFYFEVDKFYSNLDKMNRAI